MDSEELENQALIEAIIHAESGGNPRALSPVGAQGLMQIMPATGQEIAQELGEDYQPFDADQNRRFGTHYMKKLKGMFGETAASLAAYNWGMGNVRRSLNERNATSYLDIEDMVPEETYNYVNKVLKKQQELMAKNSSKQIIDDLDKEDQTRKL